MSALGATRATQLKVVSYWLIMSLYPPSNKIGTRRTTPTILSAVYTYTCMYTYVGFNNRISVRNDSYKLCNGNTPLHHHPTRNSPKCAKEQNKRTTTNYLAITAPVAMKTTLT